MNIPEVFYITATVVLILMGLVAVYIAYQVYKLTLALKAISSGTKNAIAFVKTARFTAQAAILKTVVKILGGRGGDNDEE